MTTSLVHTLETYATQSTLFSLEIKGDVPVLKKISYVTHFTSKFKPDPFPTVVQYFRENSEKINHAYMTENKSSDLFWRVIGEQINHYNKTHLTRLSLMSASTFSLSLDILIHVFDFYADPTLRLVCKQFDQMVKKSCVGFCSYYEQQEGYLKKKFSKSKKSLFPHQTLNWNDDAQEKAFILIKHLYHALFSEIKKLDEKPTIFKETFYIGKIHPRRFKILAQWIEDKILVNFAQPLTYLKGGSLAEQANAIRHFLKTDPSISKQTFLDLSNQGLLRLPPEIKYFKELKKLKLSHNKLDKDGFPKEIKQLKNLEELDITHTSLTEIPSGLSKLKALIKIGRISS